MGHFRCILLIRFSSLGDIVLTTPVLSALRAGFPDTEIHYLTRAQYTPMLEPDPRIDDLIAWDAGRGPSSGLTGLIREVRSRNFDLVIDLHRTPRSTLITALSGSNKRLAYHKRRKDRAAFVRHGIKPEPPIRVVDMYLAALKELDIDTDGFKPEIHPGGETRPEVDGNGPAIPTIGLSPGARWPAKRWPLQSFLSLATRLKEAGEVRVVALLSSSEGGLADEMGGTDGPLDDVILPSIGELPGLIRDCDVLVSNDSGPMHLAAAVGTPVVALFGPTHPELGFKPTGARDRVFHLGLPCSPCSLHGEKPCRYPRRFCLEDLTPVSVAGAVDQLLARGAR